MRACAGPRECACAQDRVCERGRERVCVQDRVCARGRERVCVQGLIYIKSPKRAIKSVPAASQISGLGSSFRTYFGAVNRCGGDNM